MNMETLKLNRNKAKLATIVCAKRLISRAQRNHDKEILHNLMIELEKAYSDFIDIDNEYADALEGEDLDLHEEAEVDGEDQEEFRNNVSKVYEDAKSKYTEIKTAEQLAENMKNAEPVHDNLRRNMNKIHNLLERLGSNLLSPKPDIYTLQYDSEAAGQLLDSMNNQLGTLLKLLGSEHMQKEQKALDEVTDSVERMNREAHIFMSKTKSESLQERYTRKLKDIEETRHTNPSTQQVEVKVETENNSNPPAPSNQVSQTQGNQTVNDTSFLNMSPQSPLASLPQSPNTSFHRADVKLKKLSFPSFSGNRRDWPEFRAVWKELAEHGCNSKTALAHELKHSVHGEAAQRIKSVFATKPEAYDIMWKKLESYYDDTSSSVQAAIGNLQKLKLVKEDDYKSLIELIDEVEATYSQLEELGQLDTITMRDVDRISGLLTTPTKVEWMRRYHDLPQVDKIKPFVPFMKFLEKERDIVSRMAETQPKVRSQWGDQYKGGQRDRNRSSVTNHGEGRESHQSPNGVPHRNFHRCAIPAHRRDGVAHTTESCYEFKKQSLPNKLKYLKETYACFICFGDHQRSRCPNRKPCSICQRSNHHSLLCKEADQSTGTSSANPARGTVQSHILATSTLSLYPIMVAEVSGVKKKATVFCDGGSNTTYITHRAAERLCAKRLRKFTLEVTTMGNVHKTYNTCQYELCLLTQCGKKVTVIAFGMEKITGSVSKLDTQVLSELFPDYNANLLQRCSDTVDILIGCDYFGLHPKIEVARAGENLSIMKGELGICLQGTHPKLKEETVIDISLAKTIHESFLLTSETVHSSDLYSHPEFTSPSSSQHQCLESTTLKASGKSKNVTLNDVPSTKSDEVTSIYLTAAKEKDTHNFIMGEELCIGSTPRCGACRCGKCPAVGHTYSFKEEQELRMIQDNLRYDRERSCWVTSYPWIVNPLQLPDSYHVAYQTLMNTERRLKKDPEWASTYSRQIEDMVERGVARKLSKVELEDWNGPKFYINHLAVQNLKSQSTPVRIVFNSSQVIQGISLNSCLAKGPDCYLNNLVGLLLRWREEEVAVVGDIKKMFNSIHLESLEQHCHRFLWRNLETERQPDVYIIERVNMGDTPAPAISTEAIYKTAEMFKEESPRAAELLTKSSYVDDLIDSFKDVTEAQQITSQAEAMLSKGGFKVKCWQFSGKDENHNKASKGLLKGTKDNLRVLGLGWRPEEDVMIFQVTLNFSQKRKGQRTGPNLEEMEAPAGIPTNLTRRMVLEQVMAIYDPLGFLSPFTLQAKVYLRETWELKLGWDDTVPYSLQRKWMKFFQSMFEMEDIKYERCLRPSKAVGKPSLVILSDGSNIAYGCAAYILWTLEDGNHWLRLIMAKSRIAPINRLSTPQMELNGAVMSKRARATIEKEMKFDFERVFHLVDSETVLNMINKTSTRFKVYEGVRLGEIQASTNGDMSSWAWISGEDNIADWLTRGRSPHHLTSDSEWWRGPDILYRPVKEWGLKFGLQQEGTVPGEKKLCSTATVLAVESLIDYTRFSSINRVIWVIGRLQNMFKYKSFKGGKSSHVTPKGLREAEQTVVKDVQSTILDDLQESCGKSGRYSRLNPVKGTDGIWTVGERMKRFNAMTSDSELQKLLPSGHYVTRLFMRRAHKTGHRGRNATLARFRQNYWVPHGDKLARSVKNNCQMCKLREPKLLCQAMGPLPEARLKPSTPFNHVMVDLFGPYKIRGEVQKRTTGKAYGVIFTDLTSRAVHIEAVFGYDTSSFLIGFSRFVSMRGWPETMYSDPGSQLIGADRELKEAWKTVDKGTVTRRSAENGLKWIFGPADSPWHQGAVESLVRGAKRAINFAVHNQRLSASEFMTVCAEVTNLMNERPIGAQLSEDSDINVFTPNCLLLGRATIKNPGGWQPTGSVQSRYRLVQKITDDFWQKWTELFAPSLVVRQKWSTSHRNVKPGDVVLVADQSVLRGEYRLGLIKEVFPSSDGKVRKVTLTYKNHRVGEKSSIYTGVKDTTVTRSVQRLAVLVPVNWSSTEDED